MLIRFIFTCSELSPPKNRRKKNNKRKRGQVRHKTLRRTDRCVNPFKFTGHVGKDLKKITSKMLQRFNLHKKDKICAACRSHVYHSRPKSKEMENNVELLDEMEVTIPEIDQQNDDSRSSREIELEEMFEQLKLKFSTLSINDPLKVKILTVAHEHWSLRKIAGEFKCSIHLARNSKKLKETKGLFGDVCKKKGKNLPEKIVEEVKNFYNSDEMSRAMASMKDAVSMNVDGQKMRVPRRMLLHSLKELYFFFKEKHPNVKLSFSMFAKLRPKNCVLPGQSGTHLVCVCTIHQNVKMMLDAIDLQK